VEGDAARAAGASGVLEDGEEAVAQTAPTPGKQDGESAEAVLVTLTWGVGEDAGRADDARAGRIERMGDGVVGDGVDFVELDGKGDALLVNEDGDAHRDSAEPVRERLDERDAR
jgi:hypothetical protein